MNLRKKMLALGLAVVLSLTSVTVPAMQADAATDTNLDVEYNYME